MMPRSSFVRRRGSFPRSVRVLALAVVALGLALGCGGDPEPPAAVAGCSRGSIARTDGSCMPVGIQGCAEMFVEEDGLCHPRMEKCPAGTIPKFDEGCVPVGIQGCADMFMEEDGLCHPSMEKCPAGTIPKFGEGCAPVGIQFCAEVFMEEDGLCHPSMDKCPAGTFAVPQEGCLPIDGPSGCGSGTWGYMQEDPNVTTIWVDPSVAASGDGSQATPVKTIAEALALVPAGGRIALGAGTYDEPIYVTKPMTIEGRCPSMVRVQGTGDSSIGAYVVWVHGADNVTLRRIEIGGAGLGILATTGTHLEINGVHLRSATSVGLEVQGFTTEVSIARSLIEGTLAENGLGGRGVEVADGAWVTFTASAIVANREIGVFAIDTGTDVTLTDSLVEGTLPEEGSGDDGRGAGVEAGATLRLADSAVVKNHEEGVIALEHTTKLVLVGSLVERTLPSEATAQLGEGVVVVTGADATIVGTAVLGNRRTGVLAQDPGTEVTVTGCLVKDTLPQQSDGTCTGVAVLGATLTLGESAITDTYGVGLIAAEMNTNVTATGVLIERQISRGIYAYHGGIAAIDRSAVVENRKMGISVEDANTDVTVTGSLVAGTLPNPDTGKSGRGVDVLNGAHATLGANAIVANRDIGISVEVVGAEVMATGNLVAGTMPRENDSNFGRGANVDRGATLLFDGNALVDNHEFGLYAGSAETVLTARGNLIEGTLPQESDDLFGRGVGVELGAQATLEANAIVANQETGIFVHASSAIVTGNLIEGTLAREIDGQLGIGVVSAGQATLQLVSSVIQDSRVSALLVANAAASVSQSLIDVVPAGSFAMSDSTGTIDDVGDGLLAMLGSTLDITDTRVQGCIRSGILFDDSSGALSGVVSTENEFGLVLQGARQTSYEDGGNQLTGNRTQDIVIGGALPVPGGASLVPRSP